MRVLITGASRGIGAAIARVFAERHGPEARLALLGRSATAPSHPRLEGTLEEVAHECAARHGARATPLGVDLRDAVALRAALAEAQRALGGGLDVLVNNASVLALDPSSPRDMDLVHAVNVRGTLLCLHDCAPALRASRGAIVTLAPPVRLGRLDWIAAPSPAYTLSKYAMTLATLAAADGRVRANALWPKRLVRTAATRRLEAEAGVAGAHSRGRDPRYVAEAVYALATSERTAHALYDEDVLPPPDDAAPLDAYVIACDASAAAATRGC
jgi:NAD(P)-dependent dehydrogenase (short-subunit alcohol dehydrogenase family)